MPHTLFTLLQPALSVSLHQADGGLNSIGLYADSLTVTKLELVFRRSVVPTDCSAS